MGKCDFCKVETDLLFKCNLCGELFCKDHRLPKNHLCPNEKTSSNHFKDNIEPLIIHKNEEKTQNERSQGINISLRIPNTIAILFLIILSISTLYTIYLGAYNAGYNIAYNTKYTEGEQIGYKTGYKQGFEEAFVIGYYTGNTSGFLSGVENGETVGYQQGYTDGENNAEEIGFIEGNHTAFLEYYQYGLDDVKNRGYNVSDPSYSLVSSFIKKDETDKELYISGIFDDHDFAQKVKDNAFKNGIHCYYVELKFVDPSSYAIVAFKTTDRGIVFYEPQTDESVDVGIGIRYWRDRGLNTNRDDTITGIEFVW